jgi:hypothetical protein
MPVGVPVQSTSWPDRTAQLKPPLDWVAGDKLNPLGNVSLNAITPLVVVDPSFFSVTV